MPKILRIGSYSERLPIPGNGCPLITRMNLARHSRNQKIHLNHEKHKNSRKKANTVLSRDCGKDAEHTEERQIHFTMKNMKVMK